MLERLDAANHRQFPLSCKDLFVFLAQEVSGANHTYQRLEADRKSKWKSWTPGDGPGWWQIPEDPNDRSSLAWDLYNTIAETRCEGDGIIFEMYHARTLAANVGAFTDEWRGYLRDAIQSIAQAELQDHDATSAKDQKFGILASPAQLNDDLSRSPGILGRALIYLDIDNFKALNSRLTETVVDVVVLPAFHRLLRDCAASIGTAYAEGGDEFVILLPNTSRDMAIAFANSLRDEIARLEYDKEALAERTTASLGIAWEHDPSDGVELKVRANKAERAAKEAGRNQVIAAE